MASEHERDSDRKRVGRRHPKDVKLAIGKLLCTGVPPGTVEALADSLEVTPRTVRSWRKWAAAAPDERPRLGRPRRDDAVRALALTRVQAELARDGSQSARAVHRALEGEVSRTLVLEIWKELRAERAAVLRRERAQWSRHTRVEARDAIWSLDGTHLGRDPEDQAVVAEIVRDVGSGKTVAASLGGAPTSQRVAQLLKSYATVSGAQPLVIAHDNGPENQDAVQRWCRQNQIVELRSLPHTPQHNPWVEHGHAEIKQATGLGKGAYIDDLVLANDAMLVALRHIDGVRRRPTRGMRTASEAYEQLPVAHRLVDRRAFYEEAHCAIDAAVQGLKNKREQRLAEREAILHTLERHGLVTRTKGRRPLPLAKGEGVS